MTKAAELAKIGEVATNSQIGGRRNIVINGAMQVAQRATEVTGIGASAGYFTVDRFDMFFSGTAGRLTQSQVAVTDLPGFANALKLQCTTADTSIASGETAQLQYAIEGQDLQQLKKGTSSAEKTTISFYVKGNAAATYTIEFQDNDNSRHNTQTFAVTTSWNRVSLTFDGDTTGAFDDDSAASVRIQIYLQAGATYTGGTFTSNTWAGVTNANTVKSDQTMFFDSTDRNLFITGIQMEVGSQATPFEHRSFGEEQELCKRYFQKINNLQCFATTNTSERLRINANCIPVMRAGGTAVIIAAMRFINEGAAYYSADTSEAQAGPKGAAAFQMDIDNFSTNSNGDGGGTTPTNSAAFLGEADAFIFTYDAEL